MMSSLPRWARCLQPLRSEPRFQALLRRMNFPGSDIHSHHLRGSSEDF